MMAHLVDWSFLTIALVLPIFIIFKLKWQIAIPLSALVVWISLIFAGLLLESLDPNRDHSPSDTIWTFFGWIGGLLYALTLWIIKNLIQLAITPRN
ncbi:hypothetical protein FEM03_21730 [Phragmitibacter flavus]|uniref:Uncharacterized protein n=1 Tax=Phragmitibacter flavus TaxID=2576071 RepID=A0A5R8K8J3_9BACT|nr:hypothetical protein [Phragmitibacter flavus]TLD68662.1 hypothetical protein FEM03_21730 [Phragmitibacter flavus]